MASTRKRKLSSVTDNDRARKKIAVAVTGKEIVKFERRSDQVTSESMSPSLDQGQLNERANSSPPAQPKKHLLSLPNELLLKIHKYLCPVTSACLGVTNRRNYSIHRTLHGTVNLTKQQFFFGGGSVAGISLASYMIDWMPEDMKLYLWGRGFIRRTVDTEKVKEIYRNCGKFHYEYRKNVLRQWGKEGGLKLLE